MHVCISMFTGEQCYMAFSLSTKVVAPACTTCDAIEYSLKQRFLFGFCVKRNDTEINLSGVNPNENDIYFSI